jgi:serine/threonine protein kinase/tetratricopeptide (TPR) repeat protein
MMKGHVLAERFELERRAGVGGMGAVYRALDRETGHLVAVKVLRDCGVDDAERFTREAQVLAGLSHPSVVRYVAHGVDSDGAPYLAMEWLEGENLDERLDHAGLTMGESVALAQKVAAALSTIHALGVIHRDIKPSNIFLREGLVERATIIDFGIARTSRGARGATRTGLAIGTPAYMAPEQARGTRALDERADIFSLGCVLFECLTGRPAFTGEHAMAVLAKVLLEDAPFVRDLRPDVPEALDTLISRMLSKEPERRPAGASDVLAALAALGSLEGERGVRRASVNAPPTGLTGGEQRLVSVLLVEPSSEDRASQEFDDPEQKDGFGRPTPVLSQGSTVIDVALLTVISEHRARFDRLADGTRVVALLGAGAATDQAARAARCALSVRTAFPERPMALATGRGKVGGRWPVGEVIDRAAELLRRAEAGKPIRIDEVTAGLLDDRFDVRLDADVRLLCGEREAEEGARTLLGKRTACVGRERELSALQGLFEECAAESVAQAVLITAPAGVGKSRLRHEFVQRVRAHGSHGEVEVWVARGDPMRAGAPFGLLGQMVRHTARMISGEPLAVRQQKLLARVSRVVGPDLQRTVAEFLGEMVGSPFPDRESIKLRAARQDPMLMGDQMRRAFVDFIEAECQAHPVVMVLEDLHWGDRSTVEYLDTSLRLLRQSPLLVLSLARSEVYDLFPKLWSERKLTEMRLGELSRKAAEKLSRQVLGEAATAETVARLWERSAGNAFFLEELLRVEVEGRVGDVPATLLAMVQSRLEGLEPEARRVLRAGSVLGELFWHGALSALLGQAGSVGLDALLSDLEKRELIARRSAAKFQGEREYGFRHALVREAAYGMLTDEDRALGHRLAGAWLERVGETDPRVIAEHFDRGDSRAAAVPWYRRAAEQALGGNDFAAALARAARAIICGAEASDRGELLLIQAEAHRWKGEFAEAARSAIEAMAALPRGGGRWWTAVGLVANFAGPAVDTALKPLDEVLAEPWSGEGVTGAEVIALAWTEACLRHLGKIAWATKLRAWIDAVADRFPDDPAVRGHVQSGRALRALLGGDPGGYRELLEAAVGCLLSAGDVRMACQLRLNIGYAYNQLGAYGEAVPHLRGALSDAERMGLPNIAAGAKSSLGVALAELGEHAEARVIEAEAAAAFAAQGDQRLEGCSRIYLAGILRRAGELDGAEAEARRAIDLLVVAPAFQPYALAELSEVLLATGRAPLALTHARRAVELLGENVQEGEALARLILARALDASGDGEAAHAAIAVARARLLERAARIEPRFRASFLQKIPENAATIALSDLWSEAELRG